MTISSGNLVSNQLVTIEMPGGDRYLFAFYFLFSLGQDKLNSLHSGGFRGGLIVVDASVNLKIS